MISATYPHARVQQIITTAHPSASQKAADLQKLMNDHAKVFDGICRIMDCEPVHLTLKEGATPVQSRGYRNVPVSLLEMF